MALHPFLETKRFEVLIKLPPFSEGSDHKKGEIIRDHSTILHNYPDVYKELPWYERRTLTEMMSVKFIEVINYVGYDRIGDNLKVTCFKLGNMETINPTFEGYIVNGRLYRPCDVLPSLYEYKVEDKLKVATNEIK